MTRLKKCVKIVGFVLIILIASLGIGLFGAPPPPPTRKREDSIEVVFKKELIESQEDATDQNSQHS